MKFLVSGVFILMLFASCEKSIDIKPEVLQAALVVDAQIENGQPPIVQLSNSINYFSTISQEILAASFVHNAVVTISDGTRTHQLKEYSTPIGGGYNIYYYSIDSSHLSTAVIGSFGKKYTLQVQANNKQYSAETTIPLLAKTLDSLWWTPTPKNEDSSKAVLMSRITDPVGYGNYIRYFTKVNKGNFLPGATSAFDDQITDGKTYDIQVGQGIDRNSTDKKDDHGYFKRGDTVTVKFCNIDKATYDFWRTLEFGYESVGNPFSSPTKVLGNVSNGALGAFCGYAAQYKTLMIPK